MHFTSGGLGALPETGSAYYQPPSDPMSVISDTGSLLWYDVFLWAHFSLSFVKSGYLKSTHIIHS